MIDQAFKEPPKIYRGTELWMLNDRLEDSELHRQIKEMSEKGFYSFIARTYIGLKSDYPGPEFMKRMKTIIEAAKKYDMKVFLQAGYMPEAVLGLPGEYSLKNIQTCRETDQNQSGDLVCCHDGINYRIISSQTILDMLNPEAVRFYMKQSYEDMWQQFSDEFGKTIISVWVDEPSYSKSYLPWSPVLPARFHEKWQYELTDKIYLLYVDDSGCETVRYHYWQTVLELMKDAYFTEVRDWCHHHKLLFSGHLMSEDTLQSQIARACTTMPFYKYFDIPGIDYLTVEMNWRFNSIPPKRETNTRQYGLINTPLQCSSAAHQAGKHDVLCEMFGVSTQNLVFRDQKHLFDHFASLGINHKCVHGIFYSLRGRGKRAYPPHIHYYQPYWPNYGLLNDYMARASWFISQGCPVCDVLVLHPIDSAFCEYHGPSVDQASNNDLVWRDQAFHGLLQNLLACQYDFELGDEETIREWGLIDDQGRFQIGQMSYRILVLPELKTIRSATLLLIEQFADKGGKVFILGQMPHLVDGYSDTRVKERLLSLPGIAVVADQTGLLACLAAEDKPYQFECFEDATQIQLNYRRDGDVHYYFLFNRDCKESKSGRLSMTGKLSALVWEGKDGVRHESPATYDPLTDRTHAAVRIEAGGSLMLTLENDETDHRKQQSPNKPASCLFVDGPWTVKRKDPNVLLLEFCRYRKNEQDEWSSLYPILAVQEKLTDEQYIGPVSLAFPFKNEIPLTGLKIAIEEPGAWEIRVDGTLISNKPDGFYMAKEFECIRIPGIIKPGSHKIEVRRSFMPLTKAKSSITSLFEDLPGVELEALYLLGDFAVIGQREPTKTNCIRMNRNLSLDQENGVCHTELVSAGYPFYAGTVVLRRHITIDAGLVGESGLYLELDGFRACYACILVNGKEAGLVAWAPYKVDITGMMQQGENTIEIELTNSLRNLLGPYHRPKGEFGECWPGYGMPNLPWLGAVSDYDGEKIINWAEHREPDTAGWTEAYLQVSFGINGISLTTQ